MLIGEGSAGPFVQPTPPFVDDQNDPVPETPGCSYIESTRHLRMLALPHGAATPRCCPDKKRGSGFTGLVDSHVHVNEPGRTEWEGFATATRAAIAGGVTTIVDMPLNSIPATTTLEALHVKRAAAKGQVAADVAFWGGAVPGNLDQLRPLHEAGVVGFKCFLLDSGVPEFPPLDDAGLRAALAELAAFDGLLIAHAEDADVIAAAPEPTGPSYAGFLASRPGAAEESAIAGLVAAARDTGARVHVVHLADADALPILRRARADGVRITVETCPHYLTFAAEEVPDGATAFKCCPPIREARPPRGALGGPARGRPRPGGQRPLAVHAGPQAPGRRRLRHGLGRHRLAAGGPAGGLDRRPGPRPRAGPRWCGGCPRRRRGWRGCRARARSPSGKDADLVAFAPDERWTVGDLEHRNPVTPTPAASSAASSAAPGCAGSSPTAPRRAAARAGACQSDPAADRTRGVR